ncbi:hypothetical protein MHYP_G00089030 [Metynnis hypsauchen]
MNITWTRPDLGGALVHFYGNYEDRNTRQIPQYRERTALFTEELQNGNVSLRLSDVNTRDEGEYKCRVDSEFWKHDVSFDLKVEVIGERPVISVESYDSNSEQFSLLCESKGWRPRPDLQWLNSKGENQTAGDPEIQSDAELFTVKRSFTVHKNDIDTFYCRATLGEQTKQEEIRPKVFYALADFDKAACLSDDPIKTRILDEVKVTAYDYVVTIHIWEIGKELIKKFLIIPSRSIQTGQDHWHIIKQA